MVERRGKNTIKIKQNSCIDLKNSDVVSFERYKLNKEAKKVIQDVRAKVYNKV